jgi:hypothetical protein
MENGSLPELQTMVTWVPRLLVQTAAIFERLQQQNPSLNRSKWRVYNCGLGRAGPPDGVQIVLKMDDALMKVPKIRNLKPFCNMRQAVLELT